MKTLIELYDPSPIRNVLSTVMFRPEEMILLCPPESVDLQELKRSLHTFFEHLKCQVKLTILPVSLLDAGKIERALREVLDSHPDCAIDISGGTDAALFATGAVSGETSVFTYSAPKKHLLRNQKRSFRPGAALQRPAGCGLLPDDGGRNPAPRPCGQCSPAAYV